MYTPAPVSAERSADDIVGGAPVARSSSVSSVKFFLALSTFPGYAAFFWALDRDLPPYVSNAETSPAQASGVLYFLWN